ncbi:hypothetical protein DFH08DRAFT_998260 [Mycena albidolilacea]|uniref:DUF6697 domain-containing protein n=1 Tax=Mycena albidolilacea TaxID=1033008 RepID=A0AAD7A3Q8_9AGAR|nr:hypothetical protein DFH08DRAFT_998260 [Mycena albidolilacea]
MSSSTVVVPSNLTSEMVEFWGFKYREAKQEIEALKTRLLSNDKFLQDLITTSRNEQRIVQQRLESCCAEKNDLLVQVERLNTERLRLEHQIHSSYSQAALLADEAHRQRVAAVAELFNSTDFFLDQSFTPNLIGFLSAKDLDTISVPWQLYFIPQPPHAIPLRVEAPGQSGYWFYPFNLYPMDSPFDLIVEVEPKKWLYYGRYLTRVFQGFEMKLSEWMTLDEQVVPILAGRAFLDVLLVQTKMIFCSRVANQDLKLQAGQQASYAAQMHTRQSYDSGEWNIPSYTLQCIGYDVALCEALTVTAAKLHSERSISKLSLGKRQRTKTPSVSGFEGSTKAEGSIKLVRAAESENDLVDASSDGTEGFELTRATE